MEKQNIKSDSGAELLSVQGLKMHFPVRGGVFRRQVATVYAVDGVSFAIKAGETLGLVGESGCGKTTVGRCIVRLYKPTGGDIQFEGKALKDLGKRQLRAVRRDLQLIFQDPFESLNGRQTIGAILEEPFIIHGVGTKAERAEWGKSLLERVGLPPGAVSRFPHEFSGGQRQRIGIARAIALSPKLIVCDEPVSALDVSIQSQIINLLLTLQQEMRLSYLFIAHDLSVVKHVSDNVAVMYLGKIVEYAPANQLYANPCHPYTRALISSIPVPDPELRSKRKILQGDVPSPMNPPSGCRFHTRCPHAIERCKNDVPNLVPVPGSTDTLHLQACLRAAEICSLN